MGLKVSVIFSGADAESVEEALKGMDFELMPAEGSGVLELMKRAKGEVVLVLDRCNPELIRRLLDAVEDHDLVVASRRGLGAKLTSALSAVLLGVKLGDPSSGCFAFKRKAVKFGEGGSPLLSLIHGSKGISIHEIPCEGGDGFLKSVLQILGLSGYRPIKFALVGLLGVIVNEGLLYCLVNLGFMLGLAGAVAIESSILSNFFLNDLWTFRGKGEGGMLARCLKYHGAVAVGALINYVVLLLLTSMGIGYLLANLIGIALGFVANYLLSELFVWA